MTDGQPVSAEQEALTRYRAASRRRRAAPAGSLRRRTVRSGRAATPSGPGPDARDPQLLGVVWRNLADDRGWTNDVAVWSLTNRWAEIVGPQVAQHVEVVSFDPQPASGAAESARGPQNSGRPVAEQSALLPGPATSSPSPVESDGGKLTLRADSGAWQQQMVWNLVHLQRRVDEELGVGVVGKIVVLGPVARRQNYGPRRATR